MLTVNSKCLKSCKNLVSIAAYTVVGDEHEPVVFVGVNLMCGLYAQ